LAHQSALFKDGGEIGDDDNADSDERVQDGKKQGHVLRSGFGVG